jgi:hypothetical protein
MTNYYQSLVIGDLLLNDNGITQLNGNFNINVKNKKIIELKDDDAYLNDNRILTTNDIYNTNQNTIKLTFASGIYINSGKKFLRYCGNSDSAYDTSLRVANIYNTTCSIIIKKLSIQKGYSGENNISIPILNFNRKMSGNFLIEDINYTLESNSHIYVEINGNPSLETTVELYIECVPDVNTPTNTFTNTNTNTNSNDSLEFNNIVIPTYSEIFNYANGGILTKYPITIN